jgi:hypothetical protein
MLAYGEAVAGKHRDDVRLAADRLIGGKIERNHEFIPPPAQFAFQIKRAMEERLDEETRNRPRLAPPPPPSREEMETRKEFIARFRAQCNGMLLSRIPSDLYNTPAEHEAAKARAIKEAMEAHRADIILRAADGDPAAIAEWRAQNEADGIAKKEIAA